MNDASALKCEMCLVDLPAPPAVAAVEPAPPVVLGADTHWGWKVTIVPEFTTSQLVNIAAKHPERVEILHRENARWSLVEDESLVDLVNVMCDRSDRNPLELLPEDMAPSEEELMHHAPLEAIPQHELQVRPGGGLALGIRGRQRPVLAPCVVICAEWHPRRAGAPIEWLRDCVFPC